MIFWKRFWKMKKFWIYGFSDSTAKKQIGLKKFKSGQNRNSLPKTLADLADTADLILVICIICE